jgi:hypothetical protein
MIGAIHAGVSGLERSVRQLSETAERIVHKATPLRGDVTNDMVELTRVQRAAQASANVIRTADETVGGLLDLFV